MVKQQEVYDPLEGKIETKFCTWVKEERHGVTRKMNGMGFNSWPDRLCLKPYVVRTLWIEFKRLGKKATKAQLDIHKTLRKLGQKVVVCDTLEKAQKAYDSHY